jgi:hypothetical protein
MAALPWWPSLAPTQGHGVACNELWPKAKAPAMAALAASWRLSVEERRQFIERFRHLLMGETYSHYTSSCSRRKGNQSDVASMFKRKKGRKIILLSDLNRLLAVFLMREYAR